MRKVTPERAVTDCVIPLGRAGGEGGGAGERGGGEGRGEEGRGAGKGRRRGARASPGGELPPWPKLARGGRGHAQGNP